MSDDQLVEAALAVMKNAYVAYSKFPVGAALLTESGEIIVGANHENASNGATICAERSAMVTALSQGHRKFKAVAVTSELAEAAAPCGICRQFLIEHGNMKVILASSTSKERYITQLTDLLPRAFTPASLETFNEMKKE